MTDKELRPLRGSFTTHAQEELRELHRKWETVKVLSDGGPIHIRSTMAALGDQAIALCLELLKENSELRVRDSNVTFHSRNVMGINEDLQAKLNRVRTLEFAEAVADEYWHGFYDDDLTAGNPQARMLRGNGGGYKYFERAIRLALEKELP